MKSKMLGWIILGVDFVKMAGPPSQVINNQLPSLTDIASDYLKYVCVKFCDNITGVWVFWDEQPAAIINTV